jgi:thiol-disulfide isomerase/thioredoxin
MTAQARRKTKRKAAQPKKLPLFQLLIAGVVVVGAIVVAISAMGGDDDDGGVDQTRPVTVEGEALAPFDGNSAADPALGQTAPTLAGEDFSGNSVTIGNDGRPKAVALVAHWCSHCQAEVPRIKAWLDDHGLPEGVDLYFISTRVSPQDNNYPPSEWLAREGVSDIPTIVDDDDFGALQAFGAGGFPYLVYLDADNKVVLRTSGEYQDDPNVYTTVFDALASGERPTDPRL